MNKFKSKPSVKTKSDISSKLNFVNRRKSIFLYLNVNLDLYSIFIKRSSVIYKFNSVITNFYELHSVCNIKPSEFISFYNNTLCRPFWNNKIKDISDNIYLPTDYNSLKVKPTGTFNQKHPNWFSTYHIVSKSIFHDNKLINNINIDTNFYDYLNVNKPLETKFIDNIKESTVTRTQQIKLYFNRTQKSIMRQFVGIYRYFYNRSISYINNYNKTNKNSFYFINPKDPKSRIEINVPNDEKYYDKNFMELYLRNNKPDWIIPNYPSRLIRLAIYEASDNLVKSMAKFKKYRQTFKLKFKKKTAKFQSINIHKEGIILDSNSLFYNFKHRDKYIFRNIKSSPKFNCVNDHCISSVKFDTVLNEATLNLNYTKDKTENKVNKICAIDPGVCNFMTVYTDNSVDTIGANSTDVLFKKCKEIDIIQSRINKKSYYVEKNGKKKVYKVNSKRKKNLWKAMHRKIKKIKNMRKELHCKTVKDITDKNGEIILPKFETKGMVEKGERKLSTKTARMMYSLSFYELRLRMKAKCEEKKKDLRICPEYYTSCTCTKCGNIKKDLKLTDRIFICTKCSLKINRDYAGGRNIILRNLKT